MYAPHAVHLDLYPSFINVHWGHFHVSVTKKEATKIFFTLRITFFITYISLVTYYILDYFPSVISPLYTYKQFRFVFNLPRHSCTCAYREIIRDNWIHAVLNSSADNEGENKTGANISMYTVFQFMFIYTSFSIISLNWELYDNYVLSLYISTYIYYS